MKKSIFVNANKSRVTSKNALPTSGYLDISFKFQILEAKRLGYNKNQIFPIHGYAYGTTKVESESVRANTQKMKVNAIYNGVKLTFPNGTVTPINVHIYDYTYVYYLKNYEVVTKKDGKTYEKYTDIKKKRTKYYRKDKYLLEIEEEKPFPEHIDYGG